MNRVIQVNESKDIVKADVCAFIDRLPTDKPWLIDITKLVKKRTNPQNRMLWGLAYKVMAKESGYAPEAIHDLMCGEFFGWKVCDMFGRKKKEPSRTTTHDESGKRDVIDTETLSEFYLSIQVFAAENGIYIPDPNEEQS